MRFSSPHAEAIIERLRSSGRSDLYLVLGASAALSCLLVSFRIWYTDSFAYEFMVWNLFLAAIPFAVSQWMLLQPPAGARALFAGAFLWLLFFPNAPYIVTDLMHVASSTSTQAEVPFWFDLVMLLSFAWNGLILGFVSLHDMQGFVERRFGARAGWGFATLAIVLGSFGIYLGRFLRWNSWDLFLQPAGLARDIAVRVAYPFDYADTYGITTVFAVFLLAGYIMLRSLIRLDAGAAPSRWR